MKKRNRFPVVLLVLPLLFSCFLPTQEQVNEPVDFESPEWIPAHRIIMSVLEEYNALGLMEATPTTRSWKDGSVTPDYTDMAFTEDFDEEELEAEVLRRLQAELPEEQFEIILAEIQEPPEEFVTRNLSGNNSTTITNVGTAYITVNSYAALAFWHYYRVWWVVSANNNIPPELTLLVAIDNHTGNTVSWKASSGTTMYPSYSNRARPNPDPLPSKWIKGARDAYHGFSSFTLTFTDARIGGGTDQFIWNPSLGDLSR